jgi:hypothetical protein
MSNIVLDELDKELEKRGLRFVQYEDDAVICVRSRKAAQRVMQSVTRFIERRLKLKVNLEKSAVSRLIVFPWGGGRTWGSALPVVGITPATASNRSPSSVSNNGYASLPAAAAA